MLRVVGAGLGRTGTLSLKMALEKLLGGPCYHMIEVFPRPDHIATWRRAVAGDLPDWDELFDGFVACVDWPAASFWREISSAYPESLILLSVRDTEDWWTSADRTILEGAFRRVRDRDDAWYLMATELFRERFTPDYLDPEEAKVAFERHNDEVRRTASKDRLVEWHIADGWGPLCKALGLPIPEEPFPHANTTDEFRSRAGWD